VHSQAVAERGGLEHEVDGVTVGQAFHWCKQDDTLREIHRVLRPDGVLLVSCPFYFHIHSYPSDYWRFTPEGIRLLLEGFDDARFISLA